jgi:uncharacterized protein with LGFP repeats
MQKMIKEIKEKWDSTGGIDGTLGIPYDESKKTIKNDGYYQRFQHGSIYWKSNIGAFEVHGGVESTYNKMGYEASYLGFPTSDTINLGDGCSYNNFEGGVIYYNPLFSGCASHGSILAKWRELGAEKSIIGYPVGDIEDLEDGKGQFQRFQFGDIYWHPNTGAFEIIGRIRTKWYELGGAGGKFGYPVSDIAKNESGSYQNFQHGTIVWQEKRKQVEVQEY